MGETKYIFVTGGVTSSLGKGIISASLGNLLKARGYKVTIQKLDPYINVDPGTLNPYEHGECYVTVDGQETDLDLGHYERFLNVETQIKSYNLCDKLTELIKECDEGLEIGLPILSPILNPLVTSSIVTGDTPVIKSFDMGPPVVPAFITLKKCL